jgi:ubiquinone/menaquinone biosynthesis C-methylase UbiE
MEDKRMATAVKAYKGMGMEGSIARWYDRTTRKDMPEVTQLGACIAALVPAAGSVLEVAPGPGFLSIELAKRGLEVHAVDISKTLLRSPGATRQPRESSRVFHWGTPLPCPSMTHTSTSSSAAPPSRTSPSR